MRYVSYIKTFFLLTALIAVGHPAYAESPTMFFTVPVKQVSEGGRVTLDVRIQSSSQAINAVSGSISFPENLVSVSSLSKDRSIINLWTQGPTTSRNRISFEGVVLNPGFQGGNGLLFRVTFNAKRAGVVPLSFAEGAVLANDGLGTNILTRLSSATFTIVPGPVYSPLAEGNPVPPPNSKLSALPVITDYVPSVSASGTAYLKGKGEPNALTKIVFKDVSFKSVGEQFIEFLQTKRKKLDEVLVKNDASGSFEYTSSNGLLAGVYNATPFLVDTNSNTEKPGLGVQFLISDSKIIKALVVVINVLGLLIPIVGLIVVIYFIPWYSWRRMRVLKKKLGIEEEKLDIVGHQLERQDKIEDVHADKVISSEKEL